ncbi:hypothetical protein [Saccharothrix texasensis]|uniref:WG repeat protein n=1 Tax=Saccharothrix texasensis TaxID=103734 RepID=A0A3N1GXZ8_9PSEU|nr:hypothetical protein [Saccharothrix texasensis]ROP35039.1 hypothetical protein EDD40_0252 [Saccharothrix texasensis]
MFRVVTGSACGLVVVLAVAWSTLAQPTSVAGRAHPWSGNTSSADAAAAFERCVEHAGDGTFVMGPAHLRDDGQLVVGAISGDTIMKCGVDEFGVRVSTTDPARYPVRERGFGLPLSTGYDDRLGATLVGYAGDDVVAVNFRTPDGRVIPARVRQGVYLLELPAEANYDHGDLTHEAFDATGAVIPGR